MNSLGDSEINEPLVVVRPIKEAYGGWRRQKTSNALPLMVYLTAFVAVCGSYQVGAMLGYSSPTQFAITQDLGLTTAQYSLFGSILSIGAMFGAITSGPIVDFAGRKLLNIQSKGTFMQAMTVYSCFCIAGWLGIYFAQGVLSLDLGRLAGGYGIGAFYYVVPVYVAEIAPMEFRGLLTSFNQLLHAVGVAASYILGIVLPWRLGKAAGVILCTVQLVGLLIIPESPRWLAKKGKEEFKESLQKLRPRNADISCETTEIQIKELQRLPKTNILELFQRRYLQSLIIGVGLMICQQLGGISGICFYISKTFESAGVSSTVGSISYSVIQLACLSSISNLQVLVTLCILPLMDKVGRKPLTMVSALGLTLGCLTAAVGFFLKAHVIWVKAAPVLALVGVVVFIASYSAGMRAVPWIISAEIFPLNVKGAAGSLATLANWFCSWAVAYTFNMLTSWSSYGTFLLYAAVNAVGFIFVMKVVPETKGRTLVQIHLDING
ncbi:hypothetical protein V2J09_021325 [Rumex salicifolius]